MIYLKSIVVLLLPLLAFEVGEILYSSSQLFNHHPCNEAYLGCFKLDILSFGLKGLLFGVTLAFVPKLGNLAYLAVLSSCVFSVFLVLRLSAFSGAEIINDYLFVLSVPVSFLLVSYLSYVASRKIANQL